MKKEKKKEMAGGKADEPQPHPPKDQLPNVAFCITSPPPWREYLMFLYIRRARASG